METEQIIQRLLDEKHITVKEAFQMIKDLVKKEIYIPKIKPEDYKSTNPTVVMYGVSITDTNVNPWEGTSYSISTND